MVIVKSYFTRGSRIKMACQRLSNIELSAAKVNSFMCKVITTTRSISDAARVSDPLLITILGKVTFNLTQQLSSCSIQRRFVEEAMVIMKYFFREGPKLLLPSKNKLCATKVFKNGFQCKSYCHRGPLLRCCRHSGSASHGSTWQKVILIWWKQSSKLI